MMALAGHYWTLRPFVSQRYAARRYMQWRSQGASGRGAGAQQWSGHVDDARWGRISLSGRLDVPPGAKTLLLCVHGLGGSHESLYLLPPVAAAAARGWACLRLSLRGADGSGADFYHAALTADLHAALASPALASFDAIHVLGYSLGGHLALRLAAELLDARVRSVAAICSPIDLDRSVAAIDRPACLPYRHYVLRHLKRAYAQVARKHAVPTPLDRVYAISSLREWDACTVVPRHGFASTADYYERAGAVGCLGALRVPALLVNTEQDPMVLAHTVRPGLVGASPQLEVRWLRSGGHVGFPRDTDLGERAPLGLEPQVMSWLAGAKLPS
jgi:predicted alpha/beta-fold hydrolase